jgi:serine/threonine protein kinase
MTTQDLLPKGTCLQNGKYTIERAIGQGGFGITYLAQHSLFGKVALKELFLNHAAQLYCTRQGEQVAPKFDKTHFDTFKSKFLEEARTLAKFKDVSGIVKVIDFFEENGTAYFAMEYINGQNLQHLVEIQKVQHGTFLPESVALRIIRQVAEALEVVHRQGMLHRDIKPANILIDEQTQQTMLIDFGIARSFMELDGAGQTAFYSEGFSAPELKLVNLPKSTYTDVYSLGATLYFCLTGQPAQSADERQMEAFKSPKYLNPSVSKTTNEAIVKAIQLRPSDRPATVAAFLELLNTKPKSEQMLTDLSVSKLSEVTLNDETSKPKRKSEQTINDNDISAKMPIEEETIVDNPPEKSSTPRPPVTSTPLSSPPQSFPKINQNPYPIQMFQYLLFRNESAQKEWYKAIGVGIGILFLVGISILVGANLGALLMAFVFSGMVKVGVLYFAFKRWFASKSFVQNDYDTVLFSMGIGLGLGLGSLLSLFVYPASVQQLVLLSLFYHVAFGVLVGKGIVETKTKPWYVALAVPVAIDGCATYFTNISLLVYLGAFGYGAWLFYQYQPKNVKQ